MSACPAASRLLLGAGLLAAALGLAPLLPDAGAPSGGSGIRYDGARPAAALAEPAPPAPARPALALAPGRGEVTARMRREIERVVAAGRSLGPDAGRVTTATLVDTQVRCAVFSGQRYCLGHRLDRRLRGRGPRPGRRGGGGRRAAYRLGHHRRPRPPHHAARQGRAVRAPSASQRRPRSSPRRRRRSPRSGCCATRCRGCRCRRASSRTTPRRSRASPTSRRRPSRGRRAGSTPAGRRS